MTVPAAASALLVEVEAMAAHLSRAEPERLERPGMVKLLAAAGDLRTAFAVEAEGLSDPGANAEGLTGRGDKATADAAALAVMPRTGTQRMAVLEFIATCAEEGATDEDVQVCLGLSYSSQGPRRRELVTGGWIEDSGRTRPTIANGDEVTVWVLTETGRQRLAVQPPS